MTRNPLILVTLALGLVLGGCSNRSIGNKIDDQFLEPNVANAISRSHPDLTGPTSHIVVTAYNGVILLAGQTPRADLKEKAAQVANGVQGVKKLHNELQVLQPTSALARSNDALITSKIKTLMLAEVNQEYVFKTLDPAVVAEEKAKPKRALIAVLGTVLGGMAGVILVLIRYALRRREEPN